MVSKIFLIGMPLAGKTLIGSMLAKRLNYTFYDSDNILKEKNIIYKDIKKDILTFRKEEENIFCKLSNLEKPYVFSTGGGVILNDNIMKNIKKENPIIIYLENSIYLLRYKNIKHGHVIYKKSVEKIFNQRKDLYELYADIKVQVDKKEIVEIVEEICEKIKNTNN